MLLRGAAERRACGKLNESSESGNENDITLGNEGFDPGDPK